MGHKNGKTTGSKGGQRREIDKPIPLNHNTSILANKKDTDSKSELHKPTCFYTNADQLINKKTEWEARIKNTSPHIVGITEVKAKNMISKALPAEFTLVDNDTYDYHFLNIGLIMLTDKRLKAQEVSFGDEFEENLFVEIILNNKDKLLVRSFVPLR